jgi:hypothetical protein
MAPLKAKRWAIAKPMPLAAPVTTATLPAREKGAGFSEWIARRIYLDSFWIAFSTAINKKNLRASKGVQSPGSIPPRLKPH